MTPIALGMIIGAGSGRVLELRLGTAKVVAGGLAVLGFTLLSALAWSPSMPNWPIAVWFLVLATSGGWIMAPATNAVMGAVPESGDERRDAPGRERARRRRDRLAHDDLYTRTMEDETAGLPAGAAAAARDSVGGAVAVADGMRGAAGTALADRAADAFTDAMALGLVGAAVVSFVGALLVLRFMPARDDAPQLQAVPPAAPAALEPAAATA